MCGRFTLTQKKLAQIARALGVPQEQLTEGDISQFKESYKESYNIAPTDPHFILRMRHEERELLPARWGLVNSWAKDAKRAAAQINARGESLAKSGAFKDAFARRRCIVPADGFFEWIGAGANRKPVWFHSPDEGLLCFAGLYESWQPKPGEWQRTFTIITTEPNAVVSPVHNRMPVILPEDRVDDWLNPREEDLDKLSKLLVPAGDDVLAARHVSARVNSVKNNDPACIAPDSDPPVLAPRLL